MPWKLVCKRRSFKGDLGSLEKTKAQIKSSLKAKVLFFSNCSFYDILGVTRRVTSPAHFSLEIGIFRVLFVRLIGSERRFLLSLLLLAI